MPKDHEGVWKLIQERFSESKRLLTPEERAEVGQHLETCETCRTEYDRLGDLEAYLGEIGNEKARDDRLSRDFKEFMLLRKNR